MLNALTIDVEDYSQVSVFESVVRFEDWDRYDGRVGDNTRRLLDTFDRHDTRGTFFVLGWVAERHRSLIRSIHQRGHEIGSHGDSHRCVYTQTPERFREETRRSKHTLEDITGAPVIGYRAASYSITARSLWALRILREEGFRYDSSIYPIHHDRYGLPGSPRFCHVIADGGAGGLVEFPP